MLIGELLGHNVKKGCLFGVEVEVEGFGLPRAVLGFDVVKEGSLRPVEGEMGKEYVFKKPYSFDEAMMYLERLHLALSNAERVQFSNRTSVHVHVNATDMSIMEWWTFLFLWVLYEEPLIAFCGEERRSNLFCLSSRDAEGLMFTLQRCAIEGHMAYLNDEVRYSAVNTAATVKYGSVEFRTMRGTTDLSVLRTWLSTLEKLRTVAMEIGKPSTLIDMVLNDEGFTNKVFSPDHFVHQFPDIQRVVMESAFNCAMIIDSCDFSKFTFMYEPNMDI